MATLTAQSAAATPVRPAGPTASLLEGIDLWADASPAELGRLARSVEVAHARPGQVLQTQDAPVRQWGMVVSGQALVEHDGAPIGLLRRGESWGEYSLLNGQRSSIGVVALSPVTVLNVARQGFFDLLDQQPLLRQRVVARSATSPDRLAQPVFRALVSMEIAALRRELASNPPW